MALQQVGGTEEKTGISRLTTEYLYWIIESSNSFTEPADTPYIAFIDADGGKPQTSDWNQASFETSPDDPEKLSIRLLVGPEGGKDLTPTGSLPLTYKVWARIDTASENFVRLVGNLTVR